MPADSRASRPVGLGWRRVTVAGLATLAALVMAPTGAAAQAAQAAQAAPSSSLPEIRVVRDGSGTRLQVDGRDFLLRGVNWDYFPIGTTYSYDFWGQPEAVIEAALDREMTLLRSMGVNAIRVYAGIPPRWVRHIYERYGIFTVVNHPVGRYGTTVDGVWQANTDYSDPAVRAALTAEVVALVESFEGVPGVLMWLLGNENNYGLVWRSAATEALPEGERDAARARHLYSLFGEVVAAVKARDGGRPVAMSNGDLQYLDIIAEEVKGLDVFGSNVYRGISFRDLFEEVERTLGLPVLFTEFGADAFDARTGREDQRTQARYLLGQWREIYEQSAGKGLVGNAIGGFTFQWSDGWWKFGQEERLDVHDTNASWPNEAYPEDFVPGQNNMNEEWWGITAKGPPDHLGLYDLYPRAAYYALREAYTLDAYAPETDLAAIRAHFAAIDPVDAELQARGDRSALRTSALELVRMTELRMELETYSTGGERISTPESRGAAGTVYPSFRGFDTKQSFYGGFEVNPAPNLAAGFAVNVLGEVPENPIDEIFYENRGRPRRVVTDEGVVELNDVGRVAIYSASVAWDEPHFRLDGFYRTGHYHWGYEGDFFGLYREANYGPNIDIYNGIAPVGVEVTGKRSLSGLTVAYGPELWWGANPAVLAKYRRQVGAFTVTGVVQEDIAEKSEAASSFAIPVPSTRKATLQVATGRGGLGVEVGGIWSGSTKAGEPFQVVRGEPGAYEVLLDEVEDEDALGAKAKLTYTRGRWSWYAQGAAMGLVADGGPTQTQTYTGWTLKDTGSGNQWNVLTGVALNLGTLQVAPNFLWQKPIVGPIPSDAPVPGRPRNILDDPFAVRANRETVAGELVLTWDPTPATWMYSWDSDVREDAPLAASLGFVFKHHPTTQDAGIGILADGRTPFAFPGAPPARDLWEARARLVSKRAGLGMVANLFVGTGEPNGDDDRLIQRYGGDVRLARGPGKLAAFARFNDWGPYDYHRDFNLTYPVQLMSDLSYVLGLPEWFDVPQSRIGIRATWRTLDEHSPRYCPREVPNASGSLVCDPTSPGEEGREWEIRTYLHVAL